MHQEIKFKQHTISSSPGNTALRLDRWRREGGKRDTLRRGGSRLSMSVLGGDNGGGRREGECIGCGGGHD